MTTYEDLVDATLAHGLMPLVVPQLKTITLGGAVTGLGIESTSFRHGLPHESVREMDVLTADGEVITATPGRRARRPLPRLRQLLRHARLRAAPGHRPAAGRAVRPAGAPPGPDAGRAAPRRSPSVCRADRAALDFVDGTVFDAGGAVPDASARSPTTPAPEPSDYTGQQIFYRSHPRARASTTSPSTTTSGAGTPTGSGARGRSACSTRWCAGSGRAATAAPTSTAASSPSTGAPGCQRAGPPAGAAGRRRSRSSRTSRSRSSGWPSSSTPSTATSGSRPVWLCPLRLRSERSLAALPDAPGRAVRQRRVLVGGAAGARRPGRAQPADRELVAELGGHKSLYSTVHYGEAEFWEHYNGPAYRALKERYDPHGRLPDLYHKVAADDRDGKTGGERDAGRRPSSLESSGRTCPVRVIGYDGSKAGPDSSEIALRITSPRALARLATAPGHARAGPGLRRRARSRSRATSTTLLDAMADVTLNDVPRAEQLRLARRLLPLWLRHRPPPPELEYRPPGRLHSQAARQQGHLAPLRRVQPLLRVGARPVDGLHLRGATRRESATLEEAQAAKYELVAQKLALSRGCGCSTWAAAGAAWSCTPPPSTGSRRWA